VNRTVTVAGHAVEIAEAGSGPPLLYLHGFADVHGASLDFLSFHVKLSAARTLIAPAHPGCAGSEEDDEIETMDDLAFRLIETMDALRLDQVNVAGTCVGGWLAAELAVRQPERVRRLALIGASGLFVPGEPIGDFFWETQPRNGSDYSGLRELLFARADDAAAELLFPDDRTDRARELSRYKMMRFASRIGFSPPYFYDRHLRQRLYRYKGPALVVWGERDRMVPRAHAEAYRAGFDKSQLRIVKDAGHSPHAERPDETAALVADFLK
jgi:pimeloyl-ACP methyl ester carboxylesterase